MPSSLPSLSYACLQVNGSNQSLLDLNGSSLMCQDDLNISSPNAYQCSPMNPPTSYESNSDFDVSCNVVGNPNDIFSIVIHRNGSLYDTITGTIPS